jgi:hypothetical protein
MFAWLQMVSQKGRMMHYNHYVPKKKGNGFSDSIYQQRTYRATRFFYVRNAFVRLQRRALAGVPSGTPVAVGTGSLTPPCARHPHLAMSGGSSTTNGGHHA